MKRFSLSLRPQPRQKQKSSTEAKAKMETLFKRVFEDSDDVEDKMHVQELNEQGRPKGEAIDIEAADAQYERTLFRKGLGFGQIGSRGYSISAGNVKAYYDIKMQLRQLQEDDPLMEDDFTKEVNSLLANLKNNLLQRTILKEQTNVEVVDTEPIVKTIFVPQWGKVQETDMEKAKDE